MSTVLLRVELREDFNSVREVHQITSFVALKQRAQLR